MKKIDQSFGTWSCILLFCFTFSIVRTLPIPFVVRAFLKIERVLGPESIVINLDNSRKWLKVEILIWSL